MVELAGEGLIGMVGLQREPDGRFDEIGYWLGKPYWNRGLATEAVRATLDWAAASDRRALISGHFADNPASGRVLEKAGFLYTGEVRTRLCLARGAAVGTRMMAWLA